MKRIITLQDISCVGSCSITVALPVISAMGVECGILPTAVLSTHTMFNTFTCKDLSDQISPISDAWEKEQITFDGIYTGYLASAGQCSQICSFFDRFATDQNLVLVDPAMADNGKLYPAFDSSFPAAMAEVCSKADIILPNITEAALLTGMPYETTYDETYIRGLLEKLLGLGCRTAVLTGVSYEPGKLGVAYLTSEGESFSYFTHRCQQSYHGTGDLYSSVVMGGLMRGLSLEKSVSLAADFVVACIESTAKTEGARWYGAEFEPQIPLLCRMLQERIS
ncbi:pyridoxamine kinase [Clostridium sp. MCC353]|uniref:pyridoxamine kinase n=1 Tax=Clostridium sp. MCC353 TaxID=2592646 RepID=UPI001C01CEE6|nr:pyridoxamine kinase [Clostridium sp. MCC353]MBT9776946.1 pyridoxamine kinase [Clostridium sp. MCC353]